VKKLAALLFFCSTLSLWPQDKPHRFVETGFDVHGSFANSYLRTGDIFKERILLDVSKMADDLGNGLGVFLDTRWELFLNLNLGALWGFGLFTGMDGLGQVKIPQSMVELLAEGNDPEKTYSDDFGLGAAVFYEAGFWVSAKIRRIKFTVRPAYYLPLVYLSNPRVDYSLAIKDNGSITVAGNYNADLYTPIPYNNVAAMGDSFGMNDLSALPGNINMADMLRKGGVDLVLRAEYPVYHNFIIGGALGHIPLIPAQLTEKYSLSGGFEMTKTLEDILNNDFDLPDIEMAAGYKTGRKAVFRPFKISFDAVYRPFNIRLITLRPDLALVFNSIYDTPVYLDFGISGELNLAEILVINIGTRLEDLVWKERVGVALNLRVIELMAGITTQSQQFLKSFQGAGFGVDVGLRIGF
jgi:hypothetical protein